MAGRPLSVVSRERVVDQHLSPLLPRLLTISRAQCGRI
jgi:hypothetical protein